MISRRAPGALAAHLSRRAMLQASAATALLAATPPAALARQATPVDGQGAAVDAIDRFATESLAAYGVPGAAVAIVQQGEPLLVKGYGVRSVEGDDPVDADTVFQLASNTKPMTAFTYGTLVDEGLAAWTTPASEVLPELRLMDTYAALNVTPRDLLSHRAGFPEFFGDLLGRLGYDRAEVLRRLRYVQPGHGFRDVAAYSNLGFFLVGEMIAGITGAPWEDAMRERLFVPLGMSRSGPSLAELPADANRSANHATAGGEVVTVEADAHGVIGAAGSAFSTASDLARWMSMLVSGGEAEGTPIVTTGTVRAMFDAVIAAEQSFTETPPIDVSTGFAYGLGWGSFHWQGYEVLEKGGALAGIRTVVNLVPGLGLGVAVVANLNLTLLPEAIRAFALEQLIGPADMDMQAEIRSREELVRQMFDQEVEVSESLPLEVPLANLAGDYEQELHGRFAIVVDGDALRLEAGPAGRPAALRHLSLSTFLLDWGSPTDLPEPLTFVLGPDGVAKAFETESIGRFDRSDDA